MRYTVSHFSDVIMKKHRLHAIENKNDDQENIQLLIRTIPKQNIQKRQQEHQKQIDGCKPILISGYRKKRFYKRLVERNVPAQ